MEVVTIIDLIRNGTINAQMAAILWIAVDKGLSFVAVAIPRFAGKTTTTNAILSLLPSKIQIHHLSGQETEMDELKKTAIGGYLVVGEFSQGGPSHYIWGAPVRRIFDTMTVGYSLTAALHAPGLKETFDIICQENEVSDQAASRIDMMLYIRRFGNDLDTFTRRLVEIHEVDYVQNGEPHGRLLYKWSEETDQFDEMDTPLFLQGDVSELKVRTEKLEEMARTGQRTVDDVARLVREYQ
jgi:flagellar protein FlaI